MSRCRKLSTDISIDPAVARVANVSPLAALLYTWAIPHAADDAALTADIEQLRLMVVPGLRVTTEDISRAAQILLDAGLWGKHAENGKFMFPPEKFYRRQTYVQNGHRSDSAIFCCFALKVAEKVTSPSPSLSPSPSSDLSTDPQRSHDAAPETAPPSCAASVSKPKREKAPPPPGYAEAVDAWHVAFTDATGNAPTWGVAQGAQLKRLLARHGLEVVSDRIGRYVERWRRDEFWRRQGLDFLALVRGFDALATWTPAQARAQADSGSNAASEAWGEVVRNIRAVGAYSAPSWSCDATAQAVRACGGWSAICQCDERALGVMRARFVGAWKEAA